jgi:uroporphyrinogen decarboxylase
MKFRPSAGFTPDHRHFEAVVANRRPARLPLYEHIIDPTQVERVLGESLGRDLSTTDGLDRFFSGYCRFFREMTYDVVSLEVCLTEILPEHGALLGGRPGPIQDRADFDAYPWHELEERYWALARPRFDALARHLPPGMKAVGGVGNGVFEAAEDLVGLEYLPFMEADDPQLYTDLYNRIGDTYATLWRRLLRDYRDVFCVCRFGDDLGFKTSLLTNPATVRGHIIPQYRKIIGLIRGAGKPFLWHSCGCIFGIMDDVIALGIGAKHSNEDTIAPFDRWITDYGGRIGLCGGFDLDFLCRATPEEVFRRVCDDGRRFRAAARGYALGSGNSIAEYVPIENYLAMVGAACRLREEEA